MDTPTKERTNSSSGLEKPINSTNSEGSSQPRRPKRPVIHGLLTHRRSRSKAWLRLFARCMFTIILITIVYAILVGYSDEDVLSKTQKRNFNAVITGALIALALTTMSHLTSGVLNLRWWILSRRPRSRKKVETILRAHSIGQAISLAFKSKRLSIHLAVFCWILLFIVGLRFIGSQVGYASITLCYTIEKTQSRALLHPGNVTIPRLTTIETARVIKTSSSTRAERYTANSYGAISLAFDQEDFDKVPSPGTLWFSDDPLIFCNNSTCSYTFHETNTGSLDNPDEIPIIVTTNRSVTATSQCDSFPVVEGGNGTDPNITIRTSSGDSVIPIPARGGIDQSTFMTNTMGDANVCGDGCSIVSAFEASPDSPWYYNCTTRLGNVVNAYLPEHYLGSNLTHLATAAIALQGYSSSPELLGPVQAVVYPAASTFGVPLNGSTTDMELLMSRFAIGVVSVTALANSHLTVYGQSPWIGDRLKVTDWDVIHLVFALSAGLQILVAALMTWLADRVVVPHGGPVAEAKVLRTMLLARESPMDEVFDRSDSRLSKEQRVRWILRSAYLGIGLYNVYMEPCCASDERERERRG